MRMNFRKVDAKAVLAVLFTAVLLLFAIMNAPAVWEEILWLRHRAEEGNPAKASEAVDRFTSAYQEDFFQKDGFVNANGLFRRMLGQWEMNQIYRMDNGALAPAMAYANPSAKAEAFLALYQELRDQEIDVLYVQAPGTINPAENHLPPGVTNASNQIVDTFLQRLMAQGVPILDLREAIQQDGLDHASLFYRTDHHWTTPAVFWAFQKIANVLEEDYGVDVDPMVIDPSQYDVEIYPDIILGSYGRRTGPYFAGGRDDIALLIPRFATDMGIESPQMRMERYGSFEHVAFVKGYLTGQEELNDPYLTFLGVNHSVTLHNYVSGSGTLLVLKESFSHPLLPFLALLFDEVVAIDLRHPNLYDSLLEGIDEIQPDMVLFLYNPTAFEAHEAKLFTYFDAME